MSKPGVILRDFRNEDYDNVIELWDEAGLPYRPQGRDSRKQIEKELKLGRSIFLVAETEGKVVGTILGTHDGRKGWLNRLAVAKEYRKKGLARKLVEEAERRLGELGLEVIACLIEADNEVAMKVFTRLGYEKWDGFYFSKRKSGGA